MINENLTKLLFFDIETVGITRDLETLKNKYPKLFKLWSDNAHWFRRNYPDDIDVDDDILYMRRAALTPEFGKIICATFGVVTSDGERKVTSHYSDNELDILNGINNVLKNADKKGYIMCGHNVKIFDVPYIGKRFLINKMLPPNFFPKHDSKPWELRILDTKDVWNFGNFRGLSSLDLVTTCLDIKSPKDGIYGPEVHLGYYDDNRLEDIKDYCEKDVLALIDIVEYMKNLH